MHCKRCDYPLWDLASRVCPECGLGFSPVDYAFVVNSVRFMCPHCRQPYYGTGEGGHLVPRTFACVKCAREIDEAEMVMLPTVGVSEVQTLGGEVPWRERAKKGRFTSFFRTLGLAAFMPNRLARYCGQSSRPFEAIWFGLIASVGAAALCVGWVGVIFATMQGSRMGVQGGASDIVSILLQGSLWLIVPAVGIVVLTALWIGSAQLVLALGNQRSVEMAKTAECFGYAWGACFLMAVPCMGMYLSPLALIWVAVSAIIQLVVRHEAQPGRAVTAVLLLPTVLVLCLLGWFLAINY